MRGLPQRPHCYSGYAGWAPGQLEREITEGSWIVIPVNAKVILDASPNDMWVKVLRDNGIDPSAIVPGSTEEA